MSKSRLRRHLALAVLVAGIWFIREPSVRGEPCDTMQYQDDCYEAVAAYDVYCNDECEWNYGVGGHDWGMGTCHWVGEDNPLDCLEEHPDDCGCYDGYDFRCECDFI